MINPHANPELLGWLILTLILFSAGIYGLITRQSAIGVLIALELMLNAGALNFVIFNRFGDPALVDGQVMALFVIGISAAEVLAAIAILVMLFRKLKTTDVTQFNQLKH